jgi:cytochrome c biogenesis protein CcdA
MSKTLSIIIALGLVMVGLFFAAAGLVALLSSASSELPQAERLPTLIAGGVFGLLAAGCLGGGALLVIKALKQPPAS